MNFLKRWLQKKKTKKVHPPVSLESLSTRELQKEAGRALTVLPADSGSLSKYNQFADHNSVLWYQAVIQDYIKSYGGLPSQVGPGEQLTLIYDD